MASAVLMVGAAGAVSTAVGTLAAASQETASSIAPYLSGGGTVAAVTALVYVVRLLVSGGLVPHSIEETQRELNAYIVAAGQREDMAMRGLERVVEAVERNTAEVQRLTEAAFNDRRRNS